MKTEKSIKSGAVSDHFLEWLKENALKAKLKNDGVGELRNSKRHVPFAITRRGA